MRGYKSKCSLAQGGSLKTSGESQGKPWLPHFSQYGWHSIPSLSESSGFPTTSLGMWGEVNLTSYDQWRCEQPGQGGRVSTEDMRRQCQEGAEKPKPPRKAHGQQAVGKQAHPEARGDGPATSESRASGRSPDCTPTAPGSPFLLHSPPCNRAWKDKQVSKWPPTCRSPARPELLRQTPTCRMSPRSTHHTIQGSPRVPQPTHPIPQCPHGREQVKRASSPQPVTTHPQGTLPSR